MDNSKNQMEMLFDEGGIADDGMNVDPVSGNEIPPGSMASEVRDDIPAQLSEGEYVVPADVLRFYGVKFFEDLRSEAKQGMSQMEADGRIGGEPVGMEDPRGAESALTPEEMAVLQEMGMAVGGFVPQVTQSTQADPYMQQQAMYQQPAPVAVGNAGYAPGGMVEDATAPEGTQSTFDPSMYGAGFSFLSPSTPTEAAPATSTVMLYSPDGLTTQSFTLPAQQTEYDAKLAAGWSTTQVQTPQVTAQAGVDKDEDYGGPIKPDTGEQGKKFSEMTGEELQNALNQNKKANAIMKGLVAVNPMLGLAGIGATKYAEKQILDNMKKLGVEPVESDDPTAIQKIADIIGNTFGTKKDKKTVVTPPKKGSTAAPTFKASDPTTFKATTASNVLGTSEDSSTTDSLANTVAKANAAATQAGSDGVSGQVINAGTANQQVTGATQADIDYLTSAAAGNKGGLMNKQALNKKAKKKK